LPREQGRADFSSNMVNQEYQQKLIDLRRTARVVAGGKRFTFRASLVVGNGRGEVGLGVGKGRDTALATEKALRQAKKNIITIPVTEQGSIPHQTEAKFRSARVIIKPAVAGHGLKVGGAARVILNLAGIKNASAKFLSRTKNKINTAKAVLTALGKFRQNK